MMLRTRCLALLLLCGIPLALAAAEPAKPVRMGCGIMTFDTVPGWDWMKTESRRLVRRTAAWSWTRPG